MIGSVKAGLSAAGVIAISAGLTSPATADDEKDARIDELTAQVAELETRLRAVEAPAGDNWLTEQRAEEIRGLVQDVLADADTRASLLQAGMTAGYDGGFMIGSADGNFSLKINGQIQARFIYNLQDNSPDDDNRWGFELRRTKVKFKGHVVDESWQYAINGAFNRSGGDYELEDGFIKKDLGDGWSVRGGQYKPPFLREELVSSSKQLAVERSLMNEEFNQDRAVGVEVAYKTDQFSVKAMYHNGFATRNTSALTEDTEFAFTARGEMLLAGGWKQFKDFASWEGEETGFLLGAAIHFEKDEYGSATAGEEETFAWTIDGSAEFGGANVFAAIVGRHLDVANADQFGFVVQGGWFLVPDEWELFGRYEYGDLDTTGIEDLNVVTIGVNRYWSKHSLKWTTDIGFALDEIHDDWDSSGAGWREDGAGEDGQVVLRSQFQLLF
jgi:hypothetical protein